MPQGNGRRIIFKLAVLWLTLFLGLKTAQCQKGFLYDENTDTEEIPEEDKTSLKSIVDDLVKGHLTQNLNGALVVGLINDTAKAFISYGQLSHDNQQKPDKHTLFEIGSVTKPFTALLALRLEQAGKINLHNPISTYLPDSLNNPCLQEISVSDLIVHQSGLPKTPMNLNVTKTNPNNPYEHYTNQHLLAYLQVFKPLRSSRKRASKRKQKQLFRYSDAAYGVLGFILERVSGQSYTELLNHYLFTPLEIMHTYVQINPAQKKQLCAAYTFNQKPTNNYSYQSSLQASSGLYSCAADLLTFVSTQISAKELNPLNSPEFNASVQKSHLALAKSNMKGIEISSGAWYKINRGKRYPPVFVSNGGTGGYFTYVAFNKESRTGVVLLSNSTNRIDHIGLQLLSILNQNSEY